MTTSTTPTVILDSSGTRLYTQIDELRDAAPAVRVNLPDNLTAWSVTRGDLVKRLVTDPRVSHNPRTSWPGFDDATQPSWLVPWISASMHNADGADHARLRKLVSRSFTPRSIEALRPAVIGVVAPLIAALAHRPHNDVTDLRAEFTHRIPLTVICDLMGVPHHDRPRMQRLMGGAMNTAATAEEAAANSKEMIAALRELIAHKREHPGPDMTSQLLEVHEDDGDRLSEHELVATLLLMIGAGSETTVSLLDHVIVTLLTHPAQLTHVRKHPDSWADAVEETLRLHPPIVHMPLRYATADIDLDGVTIRAGDLIIVGFGAHGRDPAAHTDPMAFELDRRDKSHLAFGFGAHYCMGAPLARLEASIALPQLFGLFPHMTLAIDPDELTRLPSFISNDYAAVPVRLHGHR